MSAGLLEELGLTGSSFITIVVFPPPEVVEEEGSWIFLLLLSALVDRE